MELCVCVCVCVSVQQTPDYVPFPQDCSSYICRNGECIGSGTARCDGHVDCTDGSDEDVGHCRGKLLEVTMYLVATPAIYFRCRLSYKLSYQL